MNVPVRVTILGETPASIDGTITAIQKRTLSLRVDGTLALRAALKLETADLLWMGEVVDMRPEGTGSVVELRICHELRDVQDLLRLASRFAGTVAVPEQRAPVTR